MKFMKEKSAGIFLCFVISIPAWFLGKSFPVIGGPVFAILFGMLITLWLPDKEKIQAGITYTSKKILQYAVILLGFGMNLNSILITGKLSLPIILSTITVSLVISFLLHKALSIPGKISTLIGVGSSICGGSAIAAAAPVIDADDEEIAQAISVIFLFNIAAALLFPSLGSMLGLSEQGFGLFAGTAVNDTSSVTAAASAWDGMHPGHNTLDVATIVKLTRTLAIIPITLVLAFMRAKKETGKGENNFQLGKIFPFFILFFILASIITTVALSMGIDGALFAPLKTLSKFFIVMAMTAIGLNTNLIKLIKSGGKPILMGLCCWAGIACVSLFMQYILKIW